MTKSRNDAEQGVYVIALKNEIDTIAVFLRRGFLELEAKESLQTYHLPLLLLSQGLERLLKLSIYIVKKERGIPHAGWGRGDGHDLIYLSGKLREVLDPLGSTSAEAVRQELASLQDNAYFGILSAYGKPGRYLNLDRLTREGKNIDEKTFEEKSEPSPHVQYQLKVSSPDESWRIQTIIDTNRIINGGTRAKNIPWYPVFLPPFLCTIRAISLLLKSGDLGQWAKSNLGDLKVFSELKDEQMNDLRFLKE